MTYGDEEEDDVLKEDLERVAKDKTERDEERTNRQHILDNILAKDREDNKQPNDCHNRQEDDIQLAHGLGQISQRGMQILALLVDIKDLLLHLALGNITIPVLVKNGECGASLFLGRKVRVKVLDDQVFAIGLEVIEQSLGESFGVGGGADVLGGRVLAGEGDSVETTVDALEDVVVAVLDLAVALTTVLGADGGDEGRMVAVGLNHIGWGGQGSRVEDHGLCGLGRRGGITVDLMQDLGFVQGSTNSTRAPIAGRDSSVVVSMNLDAVGPRRLCRMIPRREGILGRSIVVHVEKVVVLQVDIIRGIMATMTRSATLGLLNIHLLGGRKAIQDSERILVFRNPVRICGLVKVCRNEM